MAERRGTRGRLSLALTLLLFAKPAQAETLAESLEMGNTAYKKGDFAAAAQKYEAVRSSGVATADLLFNLGNAYAKAGDVGRAVASYERALALAPRDRELSDNLALAREQCADRQPAGLGLPARALGAAASRLTPDEWTLIYFVGYLGLLGSVIAPYFAPGRGVFWSRFRSAAAILAIGGGLGLIAWNGASRPGRKGVVIRPEVTVRSGPGETYLGEFTLHPGSLVRIDEKRGDWVKVVFSPALRGWTESGGIEFL